MNNLGPLNSLLATGIQPPLANKQVDGHGAVPSPAPDLVVPAASIAKPNPQAAVVDVDQMIQQGRQYIIEHTGTDELFKFIDSGIPRLVSLGEDIVPNMVTESTIKKGLIKSAIKLFRTSIAQSIEATLLRLMINILKDAQGNVAGEAQKVSSQDILKDLLNHVAKMSHTSIETINAKVAKIDNDPSLTDDRKKVEKLKLFQEITKNLLNVGLPNQEKDIIVANLMGLSSHFDASAVFYNMIEKYLPLALMELSSRIAKASKAEAQNIEAIKSHKEGGSELLDLIKLTSQQMCGIVNHQLFTRGESAVQQKDVSEIGKLIGGLAKNLGQDSNGQFSNLVRMVGDYIQPILIHIAAKLLADMPADDKRHVITYMIEELIKSIYDFMAHDGQAIDAAYKLYLEAVANIEKTQAKATPEMRRKVHR